MSAPPIEKLSGEGAETNHGFGILLIPGEIEANFSVNAFHEYLRVLSSEARLEAPALQVSGIPTLTDGLDRKGSICGSFGMRCFRSRKVLALGLARRLDKSQLASEKFRLRLGVSESDRVHPR